MVYFIAAAFGILAFTVCLSFRSAESEVHANQQRNIPPKRYLLCMLRHITFLINVFLIISCNSNDKKFSINKNLTVMEHQKGATTYELALHDFSIAKGYEYFYDTIPLKQAYCVLFNDTLEISIGYRSEVVEYPLFKISNGQYSSTSYMVSDVPEYNGDHMMKIPTKEHNLILNRESFSFGDTLLGKFNLLSDTVRFQDWNRPIYFEGKFQCLIQEPAKHAQ